MKILNGTTLLLSVLVSSSVLAAPKREVNHIIATVPIHELNCLTQIAWKDSKRRPASKTYLGKFGAEEKDQHLPIIPQETREGFPSLKHHLAYSEGCNMEALNQVAKDADHAYDSIRDAKITVIKETSAPQKNQDGICAVTYKETLLINLGHGIVLTSEEEVLRHSLGCQ